MLSKEAVNLAMDILLKNKELDELISQETDGRFRLCTAIDTQLYAASSTSLDLKELEELVGPVVLMHAYDDGCALYTFSLHGFVPGTIIMPADTPDSRGGESDDVKADTEA